VGYTGTGVAKTEAHSLGVVPEMMIVKNRTDADHWIVYHHGVAADPETDRLLLNETQAVADDATMWNDTAPTSSVFTVGTYNGVNGSGDDMIAYLFASVEGFSKVFSYTGNASADGPFVYCGFRPRFILIKDTATATSWRLHDTARDTYNVQTKPLYPNLSDAEGTETHLDVLSNGFKIRNAGAGVGAAQVHIGIAFAEHPFKYANAR